MKTAKELRDALGVLKTEKDTLDKVTEKSEEQDKRYLEVLDEMEKTLADIKKAEIAERSAKIDTSFSADTPPLEIHNIADESEYGFGEFLIDVARSETVRGYKSERLEMHQKRNYDIVKKEERATGMSEGIPSDGGFLVGTDFNKTLIKKVHETGLLKSKTTEIPIGAGSNGLKMNTINETSRADGSRWGGIRVYRANEAAEKTASQPKFGRIELYLEKLIGLLYSTDELLKDSVALGAIVTQGFAEEFGFRIDDEIINGTGAGQMLGILNAACTVSVAKETGQAAATILYNNIIKMWSRLYSKSKPKAGWYINQDITPQLATMVLPVGTGGVPVYLPAGGAAASPYGTLFGRPVIEVEQCATLGTVGDIILADLSQYLTIDKSGMQSASSIHVKFIYDETAFRFVMRNNGQPLWNSALTPFKGTANTLSPFVTLATRS